MRKPRDRCLIAWMKAVAAFALMLALAACGNERSDPPAPARPEEPQDDSIIEPNEGVAEVRVGQTFGFRLSSNETTGYSWRIAAQPKFLRADGQRYIGPRPGPDGEIAAGAGGSQVFRFVAEEAGEGTLRLEYRGPGADERLASVFEVRIVAR